MILTAPLYVLRHGETAWNTERRMQGTKNSPLTERGRAQALAMGRTLKLELVSPEQLLVSEQVEMVIVPGAEGDFGVLPLHAPTLSTLKAGFVDVYRAGAVVQRLGFSRGFRIPLSEVELLGRGVRRNRHRFVEVTQAGAMPSERRLWHISHLPTTPRSALYCGTP